MWPEPVYSKSKHYVNVLEIFICLLSPPPRCKVKFLFLAVKLYIIYYFVSEIRQTCFS